MDEELLQQIARVRARAAAADATATRQPAAVTPARGRPASGPGMVDSTARFIARHEGFRPRAYRDTRGKGQPWTVGYGRTGPDVGPATTMTEPEALQWVVDRVRRDSAQMVGRGVQPNPGLLSFVYNAGINTMGDDTGVGRAALVADWPRVGRELQRWVHGTDERGNKIRLPGLIERRRQEAMMLPDDTLGRLLRGEDQ